MTLFDILFTIFVGVPLLAFGVKVMYDAIRERSYLEFFASLVPLFFGAVFTTIFLAYLIALTNY